MIFISVEASYGIVELDGGLILLKALSYWGGGKLRSYLPYLVPLAGIN